MGGMKSAGVAVAGVLVLGSATPAALAAPATKPKPTASHVTKPPPPPPPPPCPTVQSLPASKIPGIPWAQTRLDLDGAQKYTRGKGVTIAVVDSGINASHPQLRGRVIGQTDLTHTGDRDCVGHGTRVAGIIAAQDERNSKKIPVVGVAPDAHLISIKVQNSTESSDNGQALAGGIEEAVRRGVDIINVSITNISFPALHAAILHAERKGILVVAAAGNTDPQKRKDEQAAFPASYPGVLSVGALSVTGPVSSISNTTSKVDVSAPGDDITAIQGMGYNWGDLQGTSYAAPYVTGVAALIESKMPGKTPQQIINRIKRTADGSEGKGSGAGMVNPSRALTDLGNDDIVPTQAPVVEAQPADIGGPAPVDHHSRTIGGLVAAVTLGLALLAVFAGVVTPLGIRRNWRPGSVVLPANDAPSDKT